MGCVILWHSLSLPYTYFEHGLCCLRTASGLFDKSFKQLYAYIFMQEQQFEISLLVCLFDALRPRQHFFSHVEMASGLNQYKAMGIKRLAQGYNTMRAQARFEPATLSDTQPTELSVLPWFEVGP